MIVAIYEHKHGQDVRVFRTMQGAIEWKNAIAAEWWEHEIPEDMVRPDDSTAIGEAYFGWHADHGSEWFVAESHELIDR